MKTTRRTMTCLLLAALTFSACGTDPGAAVPGHGSDTRRLTQQQCRTKWVDLRSLHGENGNPAGPVKALRKRWNATYDHALREGDTASGGACVDGIRAFGHRWNGLEKLQYALVDFDPRTALAIAEGDRLHALKRDHVKQLSPELEAAFAVARAEEPSAVADLAPALVGARRVEVDDRPAIRAFVATVTDAAATSAHVTSFDDAIREITDAELSEE